MNGVKNQNRKRERGRAHHGVGPIMMMLMVSFKLGRKAQKGLYLVVERWNANAMVVWPRPRQLLMWQSYLLDLVSWSVQDRQVTITSQCMCLFTNTNSLLFFFFQFVLTHFITTNLRIVNFLFYFKFNYLPSLKSVALGVI